MFECEDIFEHLVAAIKGANLYSVAFAISDATCNIALVLIDVKSTPKTGATLFDEARGEGAQSTAKTSSAEVARETGATLLDIDDPR